MSFSHPHYVKERYYGRAREEEKKIK